MNLIESLVNRRREMLGFPELPRHPMFPGLALLQDKIHRPVNKTLSGMLPNYERRDARNKIEEAIGPRKYQFKQRYIPEGMPGEAPPARGDFQDRMMR